MGICRDLGIHADLLPRDGYCGGVGAGGQPDAAGGGVVDAAGDADLAGYWRLRLTLGMAIDANVLINERIREELRNGVSPQAAIHAGYERAWATILDSNVTTLIAGVRC